MIVAMAGSAIGLGNVWRFPYLAGQNGGAAFVLLYIIMMLFVSVPVLMTEFMLGRRCRSNAFRALGRLSGQKSWNRTGILFVLTSTCIMAFYCVVGGWSVKYLVESCTCSLSQVTDFSGHFTGFISSAWPPVIYTAVFLGLNALIIGLGVTKGIEKFSKSMMLVLFAIMIMVTVRALTLPGSAEGLRFLFKPDFSKIDSHVMVAALGQSFFSLSIGCGAILTYGSYVKDSENIIASSAWIAGMDTFFAILAGAAIFPSIMAIASANGTTPQIEAGPGLAFITLPDIFRFMPLGGLVSILFFLSLLLAAVTSSISQMEVLVAFTIEELKLKRITGTVLAFLAYIALGTLCSLSFGVLSDISILGNSIFDFMDKLSSNILLTGGGLVMVLFAGWKLGKEALVDELSNHGQIAVPNWLINLIFFLVKYIAPLAITGILLSNVLGQ